MIYICKLSLSKVTDGTAYKVVIGMIKHQEEVVAGFSTGISWFDLKDNVHIRKVVGKIINFLAEYPDIPKSNLAIGHSRYPTSGEVNVQNQHPIKIMFKGKRIGYAIHNGSWVDYKKYEYMRNPNLVNKTDSALMYTIYSDILEKKNANNPVGRRMAFATLIDFIEKGSQNWSNNHILMFDDRQVIFAGHKLTYQDEGNEVGIMTFGLPHSISVGKIYEVKRLTVVEYPFQKFDYTLEAREVEAVSEIVPTCNVNISNIKQTHIQEFRNIDKKKWRLVKRKFDRQDQAQYFGEILKKKNKTNYRTVLSKDKWLLYMRRKD